MSVKSLEAVIQARNAASAASTAAANPDDAGAIQALMGAETALTGAMGKFFALSEAYPDLKANQNMSQLTEELTSTENKIAFARQAYNDSVMTYNTKRESFPDNDHRKYVQLQGGAALRDHRCHSARSG